MEELTFSCPVCGADVPRKAKACPECGACEKSGWSEDAPLDGLDLPDTDYTTGRSLTGPPGRSDTPLRQRLWMIVALLVLLALLWLSLGGRW